MKLQYKIKNTSPLIITKGSNDANLVRTYDYINGGSLLGFFAGSFIKKKNLIPSEGYQNPDFYDFFLSGKIKFENAYITDSNEKIYYKTPLYIQQIKNSENIVNLTAQESNESSSSIGYSYINDNNEVIKKEISKKINFHHERDRNTGTSKEGKIFNYESIDEGQTFSGYITGEENLIKTFFKYFSEVKSINIGKSTTAQYSRCIFEIKETTTDKINYENIELLEGESQFIIQFLSPTIINNDNGFYSTNLKDLEKYIKDIDSNFEISKAFLKTEIIKSFISIWKLPNINNFAIAEGSSILIKSNKAIDNDLIQKLIELEKNGFGEKTNYGFGKINIIDVYQNKLKLSKNTKKIDKPKEITTTIQTILKNVFFEELEKEIMKKAFADFSKFTPYGIKKSFFNKISDILNASETLEIFKYNIQAEIDSEKNNSNFSKNMEDIYILNKNIKSIINDFKVEDIFIGNLKELHTKYLEKIIIKNNIYNYIYKNYWKYSLQIIKKSFKKEN